MRRTETAGITGESSAEEGRSKSLCLFSWGTVRGCRVQKMEIKGGIAPERKEVKAMARDGTGRGGARVGAGRKKKALTDRISDGSTAMVLDLPYPPEMSG